MSHAHGIDVNEAKAIRGKIKLVKALSSTLITFLLCGGAQISDHSFQSLAECKILTFQPHAAFMDPFRIHIFWQRCSWFCVFFYNRMKHVAIFIWIMVCLMLTVQCVFSALMLLIKSKSIRGVACFQIENCSKMYSLLFIVRYNSIRDLLEMLSYLNLLLMGKMCCTW